MSRFIIIDAKNIIAANKRFSGLPAEGDRSENLDACFSGIYYYDSTQLKIASIVTSLLKDHFFADGNKRTALWVYLLLSELNGLRHMEDEMHMAEIFINLAASPADVEKCALKLFSKTR